MKKTTIILILFLLLGASLCKAQIFPSGNLYIEVTGMSPARWGYRSLTQGFFLELSEDGMTVDCYLPYQGVVHQPRFEYEGIKLRRQRTAHFNIRKGKKKKEIISFSCARNGVSYSFRIELHPDGKAAIKLKPSSADAVEYDGEVSANERE